MRPIVVREYARLTTSEVGRSSMDEANVSPTAFDWLCQEASRMRGSGANLLQIDSRRWLRLDNYVGVIETPCGTRIEILPKISEQAEDPRRTRRLLRRMLARCLDVSYRETRETDIETFDAPLNEWVMREFLSHLETLVKRGLRFGYHAEQDAQRFLSGRLDVTRQLRQPPSRQHIFQIEHDLFDADRPENRLLRLALDRVCKATRDPGSWRLSHELAAYLLPIPLSRDIDGDFRRWRDERLLAHYRAVRPWCALILNQQTPLSVLGSWHGTSLLFPMERIFERYVGACLRRALPATASLKSTPASHHLVARHRSAPLFQLRPDFLLQHQERIWLLDTKWKLLDASAAGNGDKYGLSQGDFYQLFAYGQRYLAGRGELYLVFPRTARFDAPLEAFNYSDSLRLWVVPFDLEREQILGGPDVFGGAAPAPAAGLNDQMAGLGVSGVLAG